jgi:voltage-gated potassium channel
VNLIPQQLSDLLTRRDTRRNLVSLGKYLLVLAAVIVAYAQVFHLLMRYEGQHHSWLTGLYWTFTTMSTLGFGDITFESDLGRMYSVFVLVSGIVMLLIVLPFAFIRFLYAPWLEAQIRTRAPREAPAEVRDHVIICRHDTICDGLLKKLGSFGIPYFVIEPDPVAAAGLWTEGISVVTGATDAMETYRNLRVSRARAVFANLEDAENTNVTLTVREACADVPIFATAEHPESIDLIELAGATHVLPLKQRLGEQLANRVTAKHWEAHVVGSFRDLLIAEFPIHGTPLVGKALRESGLRQQMGINVVGIWDRGRLLPAHPDAVLADRSVAVVAGSASQLEALNRWIDIHDPNDHPVLVLGGGKVGRAASVKLRERGTAVHLVEHKPEMEPKLTGCADRVFIGEAAEREVLMAAGLEHAPSVLLTTNDDAMNIYLCIYCRKLNPRIRIVSRITHARNVEAIHRAGADFVLSYASIGEESVFSSLQGRPFVMLGEGVDFFVLELPASLAGKTLAESAIGARTGLNVIGIQRGDETVHGPSGDIVLTPDSHLLALGTQEQRQALTAFFG